MITRNRGSLQIVFQFVIGVLLFTCPFLQTPIHAQGRVVLENQIAYGKGGDVDLKLDLARPAEGKGPFPALVFIHSGGWYEGSKAEFDYPIQQAAEKGYVAVTLDYRLTNDDMENGKTKYPFPAQVYDVKCAVRWLRANAVKYKIDPDHIGALGFSAGGHLALMLGLTEPSDGLEGEGGNMGYASRVQAVVNFAGPTELSKFPPSGSYILKRLLGGTPKEVPEQYKRASPLTYVRRNSPPILTIHGDMDSEVPLEQAEQLDAKMKEAGASHTLIIKKGAGHGSFHNDKAVWDFLDRNLKGSWRNRILRWFRR
jgi:acetyl esterase/lipase